MKQRLLFYKKKDDLEVLMDFRPISQDNVIYKVISK
jgi:muramidase (phage lysozyme)